MSDRCGQETCQNWSGDGNVCPCSLFDIDTVRCCGCGDRTPNVDQGYCEGCAENPWTVSHA